MKNILYLISKQPDNDFEQLLSFPITPDTAVSAILIQQGIGAHFHVPFSCFALENDVPDQDMTVSYSKIQYSDMLEMILNADTVISI